MDINVNDRVVGRSKKVKALLGRVSSIAGEGRKRKFAVVFDNGWTKLLSRHSIARVAIGSNGADFVTDVEEAEEIEDENDVEFRDIGELNAVLREEAAEAEDNDSEDEATQEEEAAVADNENDPLKPHGQEWYEIDEVLLDPAPDLGAYSSPTRINWPPFVDAARPESITALQVFETMFPVSFTGSTTIPFTNEALAASQQPPTSYGEFLKFIGVTYTMALEPAKGGAPAYWSEPPPNTIYTARNFGERFGMSRDRFQQLRAALRFGPQPQETQAAAAIPVVPEEDSDPWFLIRPFIDAFNDLRVQRIVPGAFMVVDECMSMWLGLEQKHSVDGIPHLTKIARKPRGIGAEMKSLVDGDTGVMMRLEILEGAARQSTKEYQQEYGGGTAVTLRLMKPWKNSGRTCVADSTFASFKTLKALLCLMGTFFMGIVKTAHRMYPMAYLKRWYDDGWDPNPRRAIGSFKLLETKYKTSPDSQTEHRAFAIAWQDIKLKTFICNRGHSQPGSDSVRYRHRIVSVNGWEQTRRIEKHVPRPYFVELLFKYFGLIDVHDHYRQGSLCLEESWKTKTWWHRIFATMLGIIAVDCYFVYRYVRSNAHLACVDFNTFMGELAFQLIFNHYLVTERVMRSSGNSASSAASPATDIDGHVLVALSSLSQNQGKDRPRLRCRICQKNCAFYCSTCSGFNDATGNIIPYPVCRFRKGSTASLLSACYYAHLRSSESRRAAALTAAVGDISSSSSSSSWVPAMPATVNARASRNVNGSR